MTLQQLIYFCEIAKVQNFTSAAHNLFVSQSSLSHSIQLLEQEVGVSLFIRKRGKKVELTSYGNAFLPYAQQTIDSMNAGQEVLKNMRNPNSGIVRLLYSFTNGFSLIPMIFNDFYKENSFEEITIRFETNHGTRPIEMDLSKGKGDLAISCTPHFENLNSEPIAMQKLFVYLPSDHHLADRKSLTIPELKSENIIGYYPNWNLSNHINFMFEQHGLHPNVQEFYSDWVSQLTMVSLGMGIAILPNTKANTDYITVVPLEDENNIRPIFIHWPDNADLSPAARYVLDYCLQYSRDNRIIV